MKGRGELGWVDAMVSGGPILCQVQSNSYLYADRRRARKYT